MPVRILTGKFRNKALKTPEGAGDTSPVRPTKSRVREAAFNILGARVNWDGLTVLDLFCGSGAYGLEALSRGAAEVTFVDTDTTWVDANIKSCNADSTYSMRADASHYTPHGMPDVIFADPPYGMNLMEALLARASSISTPDTLWLIEVESYHTLDTTGFEVLKQKKYGKSKLYLLQRNA